MGLPEARLDVTDGMRRMSMSVRRLSVAAGRRMSNVARRMSTMPRTSSSEEAEAEDDSDNVEEQKNTPGPTVHICSREPSTALAGRRVSIMPGTMINETEMHEQKPPGLSAEDGRSRHLAASRKVSMGARRKSITPAPLAEKDEVIRREFQN